MADKALISEYTYRTLEAQRSLFEGMPIYVLPDDAQTLLRPTTRKAPDVIHVASIAVVARTEKDLRAFMIAVRRRRISIVSAGERKTYHPDSRMSDVVLAWKEARLNGAAKVGARISADKKIATTKEAVAKIKDRWPLPSDEWPTRVLLKEAGVSLNTVKAHLGKRPMAQYNYQAKLKRKANAKRN